MNKQQDWIVNLEKRDKIKQMLFVEESIAKKVGVSKLGVSIYKTRLKDGTKLLFNVDPEQAGSMDNEMPAYKLMRWLNL